MTFKHCSKCKEDKTLESFGKDKHKKDGLTVRCKECRKVDGEIYYRQNKEKCLLATKRWVENNKEKHKETTARYYQEHKDEILKRNIEYQKKNRSRYNSYSSKYRTTKLKATPKWGKGDAIEMKYWYAQWLSLTVGVPYEVDHIVPLQNEKVCGLHCEHNLQVVSREYNRRKSNKFRRAYGYV